MKNLPAAKTVRGELQNLPFTLVEIDETHNLWEMMQMTLNGDMYMVSPGELEMRGRHYDESRLCGLLFESDIGIADIKSLGDYVFDNYGEVKNSAITMIDDKMALILLVSDQQGFYDRLFRAAPSSADRSRPGKLDCPKP